MLKKSERAFLALVLTDSSSRVISSAKPTGVFTCPLL